MTDKSGQPRRESFSRTKHLKIHCDIPIRMDAADGKSKEGQNTDEMLQDDDEMDLDAQMAQAAQSVHTRYAKRADIPTLWRNTLREHTDTFS